MMMLISPSTKSTPSPTPLLALVGYSSLSIAFCAGKKTLQESDASYSSDGYESDWSEENTKGNLSDDGNDENANEAPYVNAVLDVDVSNEGEFFLCEIGMDGKIVRTELELEEFLNLMLRIRRHLIHSLEAPQ